ncbi:hypothetical protein LJK87_30200 [Paenibacillus sp. P25]|nr:hypothetical protein LJK87_30200 [Paenibacillus sp. P25]
MLQELETRLAAEGKNMVVVASYDADEGILTVLLAGAIARFHSFRSAMRQNFSSGSGALIRGNGGSQLP